MSIQIRLNIRSPAQNAEIQGPSLTVSGSAIGWDRSNPSEPIDFPVDVTISVTGAGSVPRSNVNGNWSATFNITTPGAKTITVVAAGRGRQARLTRSVSVVPDDEPPVRGDVPAARQAPLRPRRVRRGVPDQHGGRCRRDRPWRNRLYPRTFRRR